MSADLAGSTAFKSQAQGDAESPEWLEAFEVFFREVPLIMMGQIAAAFAMEDEAPRAGVWKVIGDEIIFMAHPKSPREAQLFFEMITCIVGQFRQCKSFQVELHPAGSCPIID